MAEADEWLRPQEPVVLVQVGDDARAYPLQILTWHEIVNDTVGGMPLQEVAVRMGANRNALCKLLHDARQRLQRRMQREGLSPAVVLAMVAESH